MALDCGPDRVVRTPGAREREESREVAKVRVTKGFLLGLLLVVVIVGDGDGRSGGRCGSSFNAEEAGKWRSPSEREGVP